jgi:hypothetical protein
MARAELALAAVGEAVNCAQGKRVMAWLINRIEQPVWTSRDTDRKDT